LLNSFLNPSYAGPRSGHIRGILPASLATYET